RRASPIEMNAALPNSHGGGLQMEEIDCGRRTFCGGAADASAAWPLTIGSASSAAARQLTQPAQPKSAATFGPIKHARAGLLDVGYAEAGPTNGPVVILLHGWPY